MNQNEYDSKYGFTPDSRVSPWATAANNIKKSYCTAKGLAETIQRRVPPLRWFRFYEPKRQLLSDVIAGATLGIYNIPQALAYSVLASLPPVYGLYTSFFPPLVYFVLGSSYHVSIGVFSLVCLMVANARNTILPDFQNHTTATEYHGIENLVPVDIVVMLTFLVGTFQLLMALLRLDFLTAYLSDPAVAGLNFGAACHALVSQLPTVFGFKTHPKKKLMFQLFYNIAAVVENMNQINVATTVIAAITICALVISKIFIEGRTMKRGIPFPSELIVLIMGTVASKLLDMNARWEVTTINHIPLGMPTPRAPRFELVPYLIDDALSIAVVAFAVTVSMGKLFARKHHYTIDSNQELLALGCAGIFSSFFSVIPPSASLSRSLVNEGSGATTQVSGAMSAVIILSVIFCVGPVLEPLPMCILSAIVIVALRSLIMQIQQVPRLWKYSKYDAIIWVTTAVITVCFDIIEGLAAGMLVALFLVIVRSQYPGFSTLAEVGEGEYRSRDCYTKTNMLSAMVLRFDAALIFTNVEIFKNSIRTSIEECLTQDAPAVMILDCTPWTYTDVMGIEAVKELDDELKTQNITLMFANLRRTVRVQYEKAGLFSTMHHNQFYPSICEALAAASQLKEDYATKKKLNFDNNENIA